MVSNYIVYEHIFPNGKKYIGVTNDCDKRWSSGEGYRNNRRMWRDILKCGWDNIQHNILFERLSEKDAKYYEARLITEEKTYLSEFGYNRNKGCVTEIYERMTPSKGVVAPGSSATKYMNQYKKENYDTIRIDFKKGTKQILQAEASKRGMSLTQMIKESLKQYLS